jgi:hypothetical protein
VAEVREVSEPIRLWSWTTLYKMACGVSEALVNWGINETAKFAIDRKRAWEELDREDALDLIKRARYRKSSAAMARGTNLHKAAESLALGVQPVDVDKVTLPYVEQYARFLSEFRPEFLMSEAPCYNVAAGYAGTTDGICVIEGKCVVFDIKTTEHAPDSGRSRPPFPEVALQLCAYRRATEVGVLSEQRYVSGRRYYLYDEAAQHESMPETDGAICIVISPFDYMVVPVRTDDLIWRYVRHTIEMARWAAEDSRLVLGPPISAPQEVAV